MARMRIMLFPLILAGCSSDAPAPVAPPPNVATPSPSAVPPIPASSSPSSIVPTLAPSLPGADAGIPAWVGQRLDDPYDVTQFLLSRVPPAENAATMYLLALAELDPNMSFVWPPGERQGREAQTKSLVDSISRVADSEAIQRGTIPLAEAERVLAAAEPAMQRLDQAQSKPACVFVAGLRFDTELPHAQSARNVARLAQIQFAVSRKKGDFTKVVAALRRSLRLSRDLRPRGFMICQLVSCAIDSAVLQSLVADTLAQPGLKPEDCDRLLAQIAQHQREAILAFDEGCRMEFIMVRTTLEELRAGRMNTNDIAKNLDQPPPMPNLNQVNWETERAACNHAFATALAQANRPFRDIPPNWMDTLMQQARSQRSQVFALLMPAFKNVLDGSLRDQARLAGTIAIVAVRRYELLHGAPPADLETAVKEAKLEAVPMDTYSGLPLKYTLVGGRPTVYSVGSDLVDQGGNQDWKSGQQPGDFIFRVGQ